MFSRSDKEWHVDIHAELFIAIRSPILNIYHIGPKQVLPVLLKIIF
jgi:hypothetical protein